VNTGDVVAVLVALAFVGPAIVRAMRRAGSASQPRAQPQPQPQPRPVLQPRPVPAPAPAPAAAAFPPPPLARRPVRAVAPPGSFAPALRPRGPSLADALADPTQIRSAVILAEVLGPPVSMR
jgi:hypothetical protein